MSDDVPSPSSSLLIGAMKRRAPGRINVGKSMDNERNSSKHSKKKLKKNTPSKNVGGRAIKFEIDEQENVKAEDYAIVNQLRINLSQEKKALLTFLNIPVEQAEIVDYDVYPPPCPLKVVVLYDTPIRTETRCKAADALENVKVSSCVYFTSLVKFASSSISKYDWTRILYQQLIILQPSVIVCKGPLVTRLLWDNFWFPINQDDERNVWNVASKPKDVDQSAIELQLNEAGDRMSAWCVYKQTKWNTIAQKVKNLLSGTSEQPHIFNLQFLKDDDNDEHHFQFTHPQDVEFHGPKPIAFNQQEASEFEHRYTFEQKRITDENGVVVTEAAPPPPFLFQLNKLEFHEYFNFFMMYGKTREGRSVSICAKRPTFKFYVRLKPLVKTRGERLNDVRSLNLTDLSKRFSNGLAASKNFQQRFRSQSLSGGSGGDSRASITLNWVERKSVFFYRQENVHFLEVSYEVFKFRDDIRKCVEDWALERAFRAQFFEFRVDARTQFFISQNVHIYGWVECHGGSFQFTTRERETLGEEESNCVSMESTMKRYEQRRRYTTCEIEITAQSRNILGHATTEPGYDHYAPFRTQSMDSEMLTHHGRFPSSEESPVISICAYTQTFDDDPRSSAPTRYQKIRDPKDENGVDMIPSGRTNYDEVVAFQLGTCPEINPKPFDISKLPNVPPPPFHLKYVAECSGADKGDEIAQLKWQFYFKKFDAWVEIVGRRRASWCLGGVEQLEKVCRRVGGGDGYREECKTRYDALCEIFPRSLAGICPLPTPPKKLLNWNKKKCKVGWINFLQDFKRWRVELGQTVEERTRRARLFFKNEQSFQELYVGFALSKEDNQTTTSEGEEEETISIGDENVRRYCRMWRDAWWNESKLAKRFDITWCPIAAPIVEQKEGDNAVEVGTLESQWSMFFPKPTIYCFRTEAELLDAYCRYTRSSDVDMLQGYNCKPFDFRYIIDRCRKKWVAFCRNGNEALEDGEKNFLGKSLTQCDSYRYKTTRTRAHGEQKHAIINIAGVDVFDLLPYYIREFKYTSNTLANVSKQILGETKEDVPHTSIPSLFERNRKRLVTYCLKDAELPLMLMTVGGILPFGFALGRLTSMMTLGDLYQEGQLARVLSYLRRFIRMKAYPYIFPDGGQIEDIDEFQYEKVLETVGIDQFFIDGPKKIYKRRRKKMGYEGAYVFDVLAGFYPFYVPTFDFASLYPSLIIAYNFSFDMAGSAERFGKWGIDANDPLQCNKTTKQYENPKRPGEFRYIYFLKWEREGGRKGVFAEMEEHLLRERSRIKQLMDQHEPGSLLYNRHFNEQLVIKLMCNGAYGVTGFLGSPLYAPYIAESITTYGRITILKIKDVVENEFNGKVIGGDTDSIFPNFNFTEPNAAIEMINTRIIPRLNECVPKPMKIEFEKFCHNLVLVAKKRYFYTCFMPYTDPVTKLKVMPQKGKPELKGLESKRRDAMPFATDCQMRLINNILAPPKGNIEKAIAKSVRYISHQISELIGGRIPLFQLIQSRNYSRTNYSATSLPHLTILRKKVQRGEEPPSVGSRIPFIMIPPTTKEECKKNSLCAEDPEFVIENNMQPDFRYIVERKVVKPVDRILSLFERQATVPMKTESGESLGKFVQQRQVVNPLLRAALEPYRQWNWKTSVKPSIARSLTAPIVAQHDQRQTTLFKHFVTKVKCIICDRVQNAKVCSDCKTSAASSSSSSSTSFSSSTSTTSSAASSSTTTETTINEMKRNLVGEQETKSGNFERRLSACRKCMGLGETEEVLCRNMDCQHFYHRKQLQTDLSFIQNRLNELTW